jgi:hypothetical protein
MQVSILDLRDHIKEILRALERNETVEILYRSKKKGVIVPHIVDQKIMTKNHPYFGMAASTKDSVEIEMNKLRGGRISKIISN